MGNFALELKDGKSVDVIKVDDKTFRVDIYNVSGGTEMCVEVNSDIFIEWVMSGIC